MGIGTGPPARGFEAANQQTRNDVADENLGIAGPPNPKPSLERETGIEPVSLAWKAKVLPLNYSRETWLLKTAPEDAFCRRLSPKTLNRVSLVEEGGFEPP